MWVNKDKDLPTLFYIRVTRNWVGPNPHQTEQAHLSFRCWCLTEILIKKKHVYSKHTVPQTHEAWHQLLKRSTLFLGQCSSLSQDTFPLYLHNFLPFAITMLRVPVANAGSQHTTQQDQISEACGRTPRIISGRFSILYIVLRIFPFLFGTRRGRDG